MSRKFLESFNYTKNARLAVHFQRFDEEWQEYIDLDVDATIYDKDKLKVVVSPLLSEDSSTEETSEVS